MTRNLLSNGFVASHLADLLLEKGEEVYVYYRWSDDRSSFSHIMNKVNWVLMDLNDLSSCIKAIDEVTPDYIYHFGAQSYVPASFIYPEETIRTNTIGTLNLLEAIRIINQEFYKDYNPTILVCSSSEVYGNVPKEELPITENHPFRPANPYAVSKIGEDMVAYQYWKYYGLNIIRTRFFTHTGPRRTMLSAEVNFAKQIALIEKNEERRKKEAPEAEFIWILKHGNLNSIRTWADVRDAVQAYYILARKGKFGEVYNIGGNTVKTIGEMLDYLISLSPSKEVIDKILDKELLRKADVEAQIVDTTKFREATGYEFKIPFEKTMQDLLDFWRENV